MPCSYHFWHQEAARNQLPLIYGVSCLLLPACTYWYQKWYPVVIILDTRGQLEINVTIWPIICCCQFANIDTQKNVVIILDTRGQLEINWLFEFLCLAYFCQLFCRRAWYVHVLCVCYRCVCIHAWFGDKTMIETPGAGSIWLPHAASRHLKACSTHEWHTPITLPHGSIEF